MSTILITGATAGIGRAAAILLANKGHTVVAAGRNADALRELDDLHPGLLPVTLDVTSDASVEAAVRETQRLLDGEVPDILVNNAGFAVTGPLEALPMAEWERQYQTNVLGLVRVTRALLPAMRERRRGRIVNVSSVAGRVTLPFFAPYNSTKHAVESISDSLRHELRPHGVEVVVIEPGAVKTRFGALEQQQLEHWIEHAPAYASQLRSLQPFHRDLHRKGADPVRVAGALVRACEETAPAPRQIVPLFPGSVFVALKAWLPTRVTDWVLRRLTGLP